MPQKSTNTHAKRKSHFPQLLRFDTFRWLVCVEASVTYIGGCPRESCTWCRVTESRAESYLDRVHTTSTMFKGIIFYLRNVPIWYAPKCVKLFISFGSFIRSASFTNRTFPSVEQTAPENGPFIFRLGQSRWPKPENFSFCAPIKWIFPNSPLSPTQHIIRDNGNGRDALCAPEETRCAPCSS